jgi:predicted transposase YdaD
MLERMRQRLAPAEHRETAPDLWTATYILMGLRYEQEAIHRLLRGVRKMKESVTYQAIIEEGREEGVLRGIPKGACHTLLVQGTEKFGEPSPEVKERLEAIDDLHRLDQLSLRLLAAESWEELLDLPKRRPRKTRKKS